MWRIMTVAAVAIAALGVGAGAASAAPPVVVVDETITESFVIPAEESPCGVPVTITQTIKVRVTQYFDREGNLLREVVHLNGTTLSETANVAAIDRWSQTDFFDPATLDVTTAGNPFNVHVPGSGTGVLVNDSGLITYNVVTGEVSFVAGPHPAFFDPSAFDELCALEQG